VFTFVSEIAVTSVDDLPQTIQLEELRREQKKTTKNVNNS
jgi:hypothetical protein